MLESQKIKRDENLVNSVLMVDKFNDSHLTKSENEFEIEFDQGEENDKIDMSPGTVVSNQLNINEHGD